MSQRRHTSLLNDAWHKVGPLRPQLQPQVKVSVHRYRGEPWFVLFDPGQGKSHRVGVNAWRLLQQLDGHTSVDDAWQQLAQTQPQSMPSQTEVVELLGHLHAQDLLRAGIAPDTLEVIERRSKAKRQRWKQWFVSPTSTKMVLLNPDPWLKPLARSTAWIWTLPVLLLWVLLVTSAGVLALLHDKVLLGAASGYVFAPNQWWVLGLVFAVLKVFHELGHGLATRAWGGSVTQAGVMLLVLAPSPFVDASAASAFASKWRRVVVGAAGMMVELAIAALAMIAWVGLEPGWLKSVMVAVMVVAGISTVLVNANPLLKFDGYFILCDLIELPNLAQRGQRLLTAWFDRVVCGAKEVALPEQGVGLQLFMSGFTALSWLYRLFVTLAIVTVVSTQFFVLGTVLAAWSIGAMILVPLFKSTKHVWSAPQLLKHRVRAKLVYVSVVLVAAIALFGVHLPVHVQSLGAVAVRDTATIRSSAKGQLVSWQAQPGAAIAQGQVIAQLLDAEVAAELASAEAQHQELRVRWIAARMDLGSSESARLQSQLVALEQRIKRLKQRNTLLAVTSPASGTLAVERFEHQPGRRLNAGDVIGYVHSAPNLVVRVVVDQDNEELIDARRIKGASLRFAGDTKGVYRAEIERVRPAGTKELPTAAMSQQSGGTVAVDPHDKEGSKALQRFFVLDVSISSLQEKIASVQETRVPLIGERAHVRFTLASESVALRAFRRLRQSFLAYWIK